MSDVLERVNEVFKVIFDNNDLTITEKTSVEDVNGWDSFQHVRLLTMLEEEFHMEFDISEIISMENVGDILKTIEPKL